MNHFRRNRLDGEDVRCVVLLKIVFRDVRYVPFLVIIKIPNDSHVHDFLPDV
jgi:hypothetical protein